MHTDHPPQALGTLGTHSSDLHPDDVDLIDAGAVAFELSTDPADRDPRDVD